MQSCNSTYHPSLGSPLRGFHSTSFKHSDDNVFATLSSGRQLLAPRSPLLPSNDFSNRLRSVGSDTKARNYGFNFHDGSPSSVEFVSSACDQMDCSLEYLAELVKERKQLEMFSHAFGNVERLLDEEITRVRIALFQPDFATDRLELPDPKGDVVSVTEKLYVPVRDHPEYNFVGRILGPRGMTAKQLEQETGCKIMVRGKGSMKDKRKEDANRGRLNWEHLDDDLHVLVQCEDTENRARVKLASALEHIRKLLVPAPEGMDELKRKQLMELAIINGTYRPYHKSVSSSGGRMISPRPMVSPGQLLLSTPNSSPGSNIPLMQSTPRSSYNKAATQFEYPSISSFVNPAILESALASYRMSNDSVPPYPTASSLIDAFPNLFKTCASGAADSFSTTSGSPN